MARLQNRTTEKVITIKEWLGVNESAASDSSLKIGEASKMSNFRITDNGSLQVRAGSANVVGLLIVYTATTASTKTIVQTEIVSAKSTFLAYPTISVSDGGILALSGTPVTVSSTNIGMYSNYYCMVNGRFYKVGTLTKVPSTQGMSVEGGSVYTAANLVELSFNYAPKWAYSKVIVNAVNSIALSGDMLLVDRNNPTTIIGKFITYNEKIYYVHNIGYDEYNSPFIYGREYTYAGVDTYNWEFFEVTATSTSNDTAVKGIWAGYIGGAEYIIAACDSRLWSITVNDSGVWTKTSIGTINTSGKVLLFGFGNKLYIIDGSDYKSWDGTTLSSVTGYVPIVATATTPAGGGTLLEQVNMLTGSKRQKFSPNGTAKDFVLAEKVIDSVDYVKLNGVVQTPTTHYTVNLTTGTVSFVTVPAAGTNTVEIKWTKGTGSRAAVLNMRYCEFYNGSNDTRVFLYGDGTNKAFYSGIDEMGQASAEYFPDLHIMSVGESNTPVTSMVRHYNRLLAFKEDCAYSVYYDTITLEDGSVTAGFYITPINKTIGNAAYGQATVVENKPRTLDGRSIYEWIAVGTTLTGDQRNAQRISQRIEKTLNTFDFKNTVTFFDKINHEYYAICNGTAIVQNTENGAWYVYKDFPATCLIVYGSDLYFGTANGNLRRFSRDYLYDNGDTISAYWESGAMDFGADYVNKTSPELWIALKPEAKSAINVAVQTDSQNENEVRPLSSGLFSILDMDFVRFSFGMSTKPRTQRLKIKVKRYTNYKLIFSSLPRSTATITSVDIKVRYNGQVR